MSNICPHCDQELKDVRYGKQRCPRCNKGIVITPDPQLVINTPLGLFELSGPMVEELRAHIPELLQGLLGFKRGGKDG